MGKSRVKNSFYNFLTSIGGQFLRIVLEFIVRTIFIHTLGKAYLGVNGLFANILEMLSLADLGIGSAILYKMYEPIERQDEKRVALLLQFYKKIYKIIGFVIMILGLCLIPFLKYIVSDYGQVKLIGINLTLIYILYLLRTVVSYLFFAYKGAIVMANQQEYKLNIAQYIITIISSFVQVLVIYIFKSLEVYIIVLILTVFCQNLVNTIIAKKLYPFIDVKYNEKLSKNEMKDIFKDCGAICLFRINNVILKATDNIIISMRIGIEMVGLYSNYYILYTTIDTIFGKIFESIKHSLGSLHTINNLNHEYEIFKIVNLVAVVLGASAGIGIACVSNEFINIWIGKDWIIKQPFSILMGIEVFGLAIRQYVSKYRTAMGLFQQAKYRPVVGAMINLIVSILLVKNFGICGVIVGTIVSDWLTIMWYDPYVIHKYGLQNKFSIKSYYVKNILNIILAIIIGGICYFICNNVCTNMGILSVLIHSGIILIIVPLFYLMFYMKSKEFLEIKKISLRMLKKGDIG